MPVSLIGTFIVLNAIGYSANTVSLLAIVLAIGIVVDDAIVVVEAVEQVMEEHPELSPAEATKRAMAESPPRLSRSRWCCCPCSFRWRFIPGISGELFRQFAVTVAVSMFLSAINALTLSPALCASCCGRITGRGADHRHYDAASTGCATPMASIVARLVRISIIGLVVVVAAFGGVGLALRKSHRPAFCRRTIRAHSLSSCNCRTAPRSRARPTSFSRLKRLKQETAIADYTSIIGLNFIDNYSQPNAGFLVVTLKPFRERKGQESADAMIARLAASSARSGRDSGAPAAAAHHRPRHRRRVSLRVAGHRGGAPQDLAQVTRALCRGKSRSTAGRACSQLLGDEPLDLSRYRSRQGADSW